MDALVRALRGRTRQGIFEHFNMHIAKAAEELLSRAIL